MKLYHGSNQLIKTPRLMQPAHPLDFGAGFYATTNVEQSRDFAKKVTRWRGGTPAVTEYNFDEESAKTLTILRFDSAGKPWLDFVVRNRAGLAETIYADIVTGPVANDDVYAVVEAFEAGEYTEEEALTRLKRRGVVMTDKNKYALFLLEKYRALKELSPQEAFAAFSSHNIFDYIDETYEAIHTEDTRFITDQIDCLIQKYSVEAAQ